jgi:hypothetical protein
MRRIFLVAVLLGVLALAGGWFYVRWHAVSAALSRQMRQGDGAIVDFTQITPFAWDRFYVFGPYTSPERINEQLGFNWDGAKKTSIELNNGVNLVVFVKDAQVVYWFEHPRNEDLEPLIDPQGHAYRDARFTVYKASDGSRLRLVKER